MSTRRQSEILGQGRRKIWYTKRLAKGQITCLKTLQGLTLRALEPGSRLISNLRLERRAVKKFPMLINNRTPLMVAWNGIPSLHHSRTGAFNAIPSFTYYVKRKSHYRARCASSVLCAAGRTLLTRRSCSSMVRASDRRYDDRGFDSSLKF